MTKTTSTDGNKGKFQLQCQPDPFQDPAEISIDTSMSMMRVNQLTQF